mgnify:CR=1 FL=1
MRRIIVVTLLAGLLTTGCAALTPQSMSFEQIKQLSEMANVSGCMAGHVVGAGIGAVRIAAVWGEKPPPYCFRD